MTFQAGYPELRQEVLDHTWSTVLSRLIHMSLAAKGSLPRLCLSQLPCLDRTEAPRLLKQAVTGLLQLPEAVWLCGVKNPACIASPSPTPVAECLDMK